MWPPAEGGGGGGSGGGDGSGGGATLASPPAGAPSAAAVAAGPAALPNVVCILGQTGAGKSQLAIELALALNGEVVNCDAMQAGPAAQSPHCLRVVYQCFITQRVAAVQGLTRRPWTGRPLVVCSQCICTRTPPPATAALRAAASRVIHGVLSPGGSMRRVCGYIVL